MHCPNCGLLNAGDAKFCGNCGTHFTSPVNDPAAAPPYQPIAPTPAPAYQPINPVYPPPPPAPTDRNTFMKNLGFGCLILVALFFFFGLSCARGCFFRRRSRLFRYR
jgi:hypothetical protein